ncbi:GTP pyrophosphokinase family protein [Paenibacillus yanchengensis]|uniref:GTP pyrophosphokinase family protein n=1 Tax=Paenibacillus yanchengensis TaxID=2035833 RepID=A0ABW4YNQ2_9BACL
MDGRDWNFFLQPYEQAVEELKVKFKTMRSELKMREAYAPIEFVTGRVKRISSILDKAKRLSIPMDQLDSGIEDIAGIRIMCQFVDDIHRVAELIRTRKDFTFVYEKDYITNFKESGYRSYHIIVQYPVQTALGYTEVLAEIQIRTLAMNFWATIEHSLNYKFKESLPDDVRLRLKKAAEAAYALDREMASIRREILDAQINFEEEASVVATILNGIHELYARHLVRHAAQYQQRFNELYAASDYLGLWQLAATIQEEIAKAKQSGNK